MSDEEAKRIILQTQALQVSVLSGVEGVAHWCLYALTADLAHNDRSEFRAYRPSSKKRKRPRQTRMPLPLTRVRLCLIP